MADQIRPTPQSPILGSLASALRRAQEFTGQYQVDPRIPLLGGTSVDEMLSLPGAASLVEDMSYYGPRALIRGGNAATGGIGTFKLDPRVLDLAEVGANVAPLAQIAGKVGKSGAKVVGQELNRAILDSSGPLARLVPQAAKPMYAVKPKGGNWLSGSVENSLKPLKVDEFIDVPELQDPKNVAINNWIDKTLTKYVKNDMATPEDPLRSLAEKWSVDKPAKLAEVQARIKAFGDKMKRTAEERGVPVENLTSMRQEMIGLEKEKELLQLRSGLHYEPRPTSRNADVAHINRVESGLPEFGMGKSDLAKNYEFMTDSALNVSDAGTHSLPLTPSEIRKGYKSNVDENPWLAKVPPETSVYYPEKGLTENLGFEHLIDELRNATNPESGLPKNLLIDPADLGKITMPQAVERVADINAWRAAQKVEANKLIANNAATVVYKEYPTIPGTDTPNELGLRWVQFKPENALPDTLPKGWTGKQEGKNYVIRNPKGQPEIINDTKESAMADLLENFPKYRPKNKALKEALKYEGDTMAHCVGGYCDDVASGNSKIFSLRDSNGMPHATVEVRSLSQDFDDAGDIFEFAMNRNINPNSAATKRRYAEYVAKSKLPQDRIVQIEGRKNEAPAKEYLPFIQDFVRSNQWSDVTPRAFENSGLMSHKDAYGYLHSIDPARANNFMDNAPPKGFFTEEDLGKFAAGGSVSVYDATKIDEIINGIDEPQGYAVGGAVRASENTKAAFGIYPKQRAKPSSKETKAAAAEAAQFAAEMLIPQTPMDAGLMLIPGGKIARKAGAALIALDAGDVEAGGLSALRKFRELINREAPEQANKIREALRLTKQTGREHSVIGLANEGGESVITRGTESSVMPNSFDLRTAKSAPGSPTIVDFHTHPSEGYSIFQTAPSRKDFEFYSREYPSKAGRDLRTLVAVPPTKDGARNTTSYNFFETRDPSKVFDPNILDSARYELQHAGKRGSFKSIQDDPVLREYFDYGGDLASLLEDATPLALMRYRAGQGLGRHELQLGGTKLAPTPGATDVELFRQLERPAVELLKSKKFAKGGSVSVYDSDRVDAIANQFM